MAENKKSFLLYLTQRPTFEGLSDEEAGKLIKTVFAYVSDENPEPTGIVGYAFNIIKPILKADLVKYEDKRAKLKENISKRWNKEESQSIEKNTNEYNSIQTDGVIVNDNVIVNVNDIVSNDKLINDKSHACDTQETSNYFKNQKIKEELDSKGLSYADYTQLHKLVKGIYTSKELGIAECVVLSDLLKKMDSKYDKKQVMQAWLYSWSKSKESLNRVAYIKSILEKNIKQVERIGLLN